jgi:hypothetical protein
MPIARDRNESKNLLARGKILNFLSNPLLDIFLLMHASITVNSFQMLNRIFLSHISIEKYTVEDDGVEITKVNYY